MRRLVLTAALILLAATNAFAEGKTTADPNAAPRVEKAQATDPRLAQKVSIEAKDQRLLSVLTDLSKTAGADIACGSNKSDWRVRDIPVTICVKDIPLGELLDLISRASHTSFRSTLLESKWTHRLFRSKPQSDDIAGSLNAKKTTELAQVKWQWDALAKLGSMSEAEQQAVVEKCGLQRDAVAFGKVLAALGTQSRDRALAGEQILLDTQDSGFARVLRELHRAQSHSLDESFSSENARSVAHDENSRISMQLCLADGGQAAFSMLIKTSAAGEGGNGSTVAGATTLAHCATGLQKGAELGIPPRPDAVTADSEIPAGEFVLLDKTCDLPALTQKVKIERPKDAKELTAADKLALLAKTSGLSIVCEDFRSHRLPSLESAEFDAEKSVLEAIRAMDGFMWFVSEGGDTLIGWASGWRARHASLVTESLLAELREKLNGRGVDLDDLVGLLDLTSGQREDWIYSTRELGVLRAARFRDSDIPAWKLYGKLSAEDKALARSEAGLPLAKFDPKWIGGFISEEQKQPTGSSTSITLNLDEPSTALTDPDRIPDLVMQVKIARQPKPIAWKPGDPMPTVAEVKAAQESGSVRYVMVFVDRTDGKATSYHAGPNCELPLFAWSVPDVPIAPSTAPAGSHLTIDTKLEKGSISLSH